MTRSDLAYYVRRLATEAYERLNPTFPLRVGEKNIKLPGNSRESARLAHRWVPGWKAYLIRDFYKPADGLFIDVGANIGETLLDYIFGFGDTGQYIGFEPNHAASRITRDIIGLNSLKNAIVIDAGLSTQTSLLSLFFNQASDTDTSASIIQDARPGSAVSSKIVLCLRFSDLRTSLPLAKVSMIKIDVEGAELNVLQGMEDCIRSDRPAILTEVLHKDANAVQATYDKHIQDLNLLIDDLGYDIHQVHNQNGGKPALSRISSLTPKAFTKSSYDECDYLFLPRKS